MATQSFIRVTEIWTPAKSGNKLELSDGIYGPLTGFGDSSRKESFSIGEGLPGMAWQSASPVVLKHFENTYFMRTKIAQEVSLTSAVAIPIFSGDKLNAVLVFLCGDTTQPDGAIEVWRDDGLSGLGLVEGYYGNLERFEWISQRVKFPRGRGLPGIVWDTGRPLLMGDLANSNSFLRSNGAAEAGISTGIGLPFYSSKTTDDIDAVITFLSSNDTPIAQRFETWLPDPDNDCLVFESGIENGLQLVEESNPSRTVKKGEGSIGKAWQSGIPVISREDGTASALSSEDSLSKGFDSMLAIPGFRDGELNSMVVFYN